jgi:hypothetical protein
VKLEELNNVIERDDENQADEQEKTDGIRHELEALIQRATKNNFHENKKETTAIECWEWQNV